MRLTDIKTGIKLELELFNELNKRITPILTSQFEYAFDENFAMIYAPIKEGNIYPVQIGWSTTIYFLQDGKFNYFYAQVIDRKINDNLAFLVIKPISKIESIQRRQFFRLDCNLPIKYRVVDSNFEINEVEPQFSETYTRDLGGGGVCIKLRHEIEINTLLECELFINEKTKILFTGLVVHSLKNDDKIYKHEIGVLFKNINNRDRDKIVKFVFSEQRKLRKKGIDIQNVRNFRNST